MEQIRCILGVFIYLLGYSSSDQYEVINLVEGYSWNQAMEECEKMGGSLPEVRIAGNAFELVKRDLEHDASHCLWLRATYERVDKLTDERNQYSCCEALFKDENGTYITDCIPCRGQNRYVCANDNNTISWSSNYTLYGSWLTAEKYCNTLDYGLPSDTNAELLKYLPVNRLVWVNSVRRLNLNPIQGDGMFALCLCYGLVYQKCPRHPSTFCIHDNTQSSVTSIESSRTISKHVTTSLQSTGRAGTSSSSRTFSSGSSKVPKFSSGSLQTSRDNWTLLVTAVGILSSLLLIAVIALIVISWKLRKAIRFVEQHGKAQNEFVQLELSSSYQTLGCRNNQPENLYNTLKRESKNQEYENQTEFKDNCSI